MADGIERSSCTVPVESVLQLLRQRAEKNAEWAGNLVRGAGMQVASLAITGETAADTVRLSFVFRIAVIPDGSWCRIPLLPGSLALTDIKIESEVSSGSAAAADTSGDDAYLVHTTEGGNPSHTLFTRRAGMHTVTISAVAAYLNKAKCAIELSPLPKSAETMLQFTVRDRPNVQVTVDPELAGAVSSNVADQGASVPAHSRIEARIRPTTRIGIRWTAQEVVAPAPEDHVETVRLPLSVTVNHNARFSVGEGILLVDSVFEYDIRNGSLAVIDISIDARLRVLSVAGENVQRWDVVEVTSAPVGTSEIAEQSRIIRVTLNAGAEGAYILEAQCEIELKGTSCDFHCPVFKHTQEAVAREKGMIAVEARTNVEVDQLNAPVGCVPIDVEELPEKLRMRAANPILLAYKYLIPSYTLELSVKKHGDVDVLIAVVEQAHITITATEEGKTISKLIASMRNTQKQYLRIDIPMECEIWSTVVRGQAVKPARDEGTGSVMIPLEKSGGGGGPSASSSSSSTSASFTVEIVWMRHAQLGKEGEEYFMGSRGRLELSVPKLDIPMSLVQVVTYLPSDYHYGQFEGDLKECRMLSKSAPVSSGDSSGGGELRAAAFMQYNQMQLDDDDEGGYYAPKKSMMTKAKKYEAPRNRRQQQRAGVVPVQVQMVTSGTPFYFERLLVVEQSMSLSVTFRAKKKRNSRNIDVLV